MEALMKLAGHRVLNAGDIAKSSEADQLKKLLGRDVCYAWHMSANATFAGVDFISFAMLRFTFEGHRSIAFVRLEDS